MSSPLGPIVSETQAQAAQNTEVNDMQVSADAQPAFVQDLPVAEDHNLTQEESPLAPVTASPIKRFEMDHKIFPDPITEPDANRGKEVTLLAAKLPESLSEEDVKLLADLENRVNTTFLKGCEALLEIEKYGQGRLWKSQHKTFTDYVKARFGYTSRYTNLMVRAAGLNLKIAQSQEGAPALTRESHLRPIIQKIPTDQQVAFWADYCKVHGVTSDAVGCINAKDIKEAVEAYIVSNEADIPEAKPKKEKDPVKEARREGKALVTKLRNSTKALPRHEEILTKLAEISNLIKENN